MYVFYYFKTRDERLYRATSLDGKHFDNEKRVSNFSLRDPCVIREPLHYYLLASNGWKSNSALFSMSTDGVHWDSPRLIPLEKENYVWAPKVFKYDDVYFIVWASHPDNYIKYVHTTDFLTFSEARTLYRPKQQVIDPFVLTDAASPILFVKDEDHKFIYSVPLTYKSETKEFITHEEKEVPITSKYTEGAYVIKNTDSSYYLYCDPYASLCTNYKLYESKDLKDWIYVEDTSFPRCRHGSFVTI